MLFFTFIIILGCICEVKLEADKQITDKWVTAANLTVKASRHQDECPLAFQRIGNKCYFYGYFKLNWWRAAEFCHSFGTGSALACIESESENEIIEKFLRRVGDPSTGTWVGASENGHPGLWTWFSTGTLMSWTDWGPGQPTGGDQHCMYMVGGDKGFQWADFHCGYQMTFLCEYSLRPEVLWDSGPQYAKNRIRNRQRIKEEANKRKKNKDNNINVDGDNYEDLKEDDVKTVNVNGFNIHKPQINNNRRQDEFEPNLTTRKYDHTVRSITEEIPDKFYTMDTLSKSSSGIVLKNRNSVVLDTRGKELKWDHSQFDKDIKQEGPERDIKSRRHQSILRIIKQMIEKS